MAIHAHNRKNFEPIPRGLHPAICIGVYECGTQFKEKFDTSNKELALTFELYECMHEFVRDGKPSLEPRVITRRYNLTPHKMGTLRKHVESCLSRTFVGREMNEFDFTSLLGTACQVNIAHGEKPDGGGLFAKVESIHPGLANAPSQSFSPQGLFAFDSEDGIPMACPPFVREAIESSPEWKTRKIGGYTGGDVAGKNGPGGGSTTPPQSTSDAVDTPDDDFSFPPTEEGENGEDRLSA